MFPLPHLNTRGSWENSRQLYKPETQSRVCITVENSPTFPECLDEAIETRKKVLYCFYKVQYFSKIIGQVKETNEGKFLIERDFLDTRSFPTSQSKRKSDNT